MQQIYNTAGRIEYIW